MLACGTSAGLEATAQDASVASKPTASAPAAVRGDTFTEASTKLASILTGKAPKSVVELQLMEDQQRQIADLAAACTVSIQIGRSQGCGVIVTPDGYVLTAAHVAVRANKDAVITLADGTEMGAKTLGLNRGVDAALVKINSDQGPDGKPWPHATLGTSENLTPGMWCVAMGHPGGYDGARGVVARVGRILAVREGAMVTDCALIGGDSGGPLFDLEGKLIGIHSRIGNDVADNLHVPIDHYDDSWERLAKAESWGFLPGFRPRLGVSGNVNTEEAEIRDISPGSAADRAGLKPGDVVLKFGDRDVENFEELQAAVNETMPGERVDLRIRRNGSVIILTASIGRNPSS